GVASQREIKCVQQGFVLFLFPAKMLTQQILNDAAVKQTVFADAPRGKKIEEEILQVQIDPELRLAIVVQAEEAGGARKAGEQSAFDAAGVRDGVDEGGDSCKRTRGRNSALGAPSPVDGIGRDGTALSSDQRSLERTMR